MIFKASRTDLSDAVFPAFLFMAAMLALVSLGVYQWLSSRIDYSADERRESRDGDMPSP